MLFASLFLIFGCGIFACFGNRIDRQFPLGTIGCLFTRDLCHPRSRCIDDLLFGVCDNGAGLQPGELVFELDKDSLDRLEQEIISLVKHGFTWQDPYTQCTIQNLVLDFSIDLPFHRNTCSGLLFDFSDPMQSQISDVLGGLYQKTLQVAGNQDYEQNESLLPSKRDEIIRVHKYFDKSKGINKRKFFPSTSSDNYLDYYPFDDVVDFYPRETPQNYANIASAARGGWENSGIPLEDILLAKEILDREREPEQYGSKLAELLALKGYSAEDPIQEEMTSDLQPLFDTGEEQQPGFTWTENENILDGPLIEDGSTNELLQDYEDPVTTEEEMEMVDDSLPPAYANIMDKLMRGDLQPENLTDEELSMLTPYITTMLHQLGGDKAGAADQEFSEDLQPLDVMDDNAIQDEYPYEAAKEDSMILSDPAPETGEENGNDVAADPDHADDKREQEEQQTEESSNTETSTKPDIVDVNFAFVEMDQPLTTDKTKKLLDALTKLVSVYPGTFAKNRVEGNKLKIDIDNPDRAGVNASEVAQLANEHKDELEKATGLKFLRAGIGGKNELEFKVNDDRYFVLTFVLCGCIAGILLAVVVIYLIRRNSRSKAKLQQIASVQETGEAASKDYQDLCRQRMQSKSSEKPEPLHAASRVGSVSESQVRSPSSRSSTSSWSEEPVNSNMDISTGHIVLSYMEDHLKNKDRLEREWDALCAYEADPSNTTVAEDQSNARKNRYGDILPYDHSRVVLSTSTNVSGSDFINASTITDHDPRNPAYIATQGPLPHTVADFWQMVWEQGSVVIVMLTKLTESGEAMCHRYWPEEGSDLYHIYEVHLVSEHIWCDDYLVRSFYLKNLQTNETRTVTQFHFLTWLDLGIPSSVKALLDFRRKVNKSYRGRSCPIVVHCSDGCGRTGTYCLVDMVLNRMAKGAKEIDIAATLEHIRDQRMNMVKTKEQFQFALAAVAEEVHAILKALPQ